MPSLFPERPKNEADQALFRYEFRDGYEQGGLLYFQFEGKEMVAIVRERKDLDKQLRNRVSLETYLNSLVSDSAYGAALELEKLIPSKPLLEP
jgi:hypothetical protein